VEVRFMDWSVISTVINAVLMVVGVLLGKYWLVTKTKISDIKELLVILEAAVADEKITPEELSAIQQAIIKLVSKV
jgi:hypothetical protein